MKYMGRLLTFFTILLVNSIYILYYYFHNGSVDIVEFIFLPFTLVIGWCYGKHYDRAKFYSEKDELTNLYNRRFIITSFSRLVALKSRINQFLFALIIDCNEFKKINDTYGHEIGDKVLKYIANMLITNTRKSDMVARWGGDEFLFLGFCKNEKDIKIVIDRFNMELQKVSESMDLDISISIGVAVHKENETIDDLLKKADKHMYKLKNKRKMIVNSEQLSEDNNLIDSRK